MQNWAIKPLLQFAADQLQEVSESPLAEARTLLAFVLRKPKSWLLAWPEKSLQPNDADTFISLVKRRQSAEPLAYLTGKKDFWSLELAVSRHTLIPRADTECLVESVLESIDKNPVSSLLDLGTGTGAIALAVASEVPDLQVTATDSSAEALEIARNNAMANQISNVQFCLSDWFSALPEKRYAIIASNPPYIAENDHHLSDLGLQYEPLSALVSGPDGLDDIRRIIRDSTGFLEPGGQLLLEHGYDQGDAVSRLLRMNGFIGVKTRRDYAGNERVTSAVYPL